MDRRPIEVDGVDHGAMLDEGQACGVQGGAVAYRDVKVEAGGDDGPAVRTEGTDVSSIRALRQVADPLSGVDVPDRHGANPVAGGNACRVRTERHIDDTGGRLLILVLRDRVQVVELGNFRARSRVEYPDDGGVQRLGGVGGRDIPSVWTQRRGGCQTGEHDRRA